MYALQGRGGNENGGEMKMEGKEKEKKIIIKIIIRESDLIPLLRLSATERPKTSKQH